MINRNECIQLGTLIRPQGIRGALLLGCKDLKAEEFVKRETVFVEFDGLLVPFFVERYQVKSATTAILKFTDTDSETQARDFSGKLVFVLKSQVGRKNNIAEEGTPVEGYRVEDARLGFVGVAGKMTGNASNPLLQVLSEGKEYLVPAHEDILLEIDDQLKVIRIEAPEGLFDL
jgi:16S rRNA processing protein RimM